ncbi:MAG: GNAT family N-acetyltransferase [Candidatus Moranbacteria bacterium]|nr:GNAT family N-acetyltransferase [Candidatus Moranbacteria bacterium]
MKIEVREASLKDINSLIKLEKEVWGKEGADKEKISSRIRTFKKGNIILKEQVNNNILGYISFQYVNSLDQNKKIRWFQITDRGRIEKSHCRNGKFIYGINLSIHPEFRNRGYGTFLMLQVWKNMIKNNKKGVYLGSRMPGYKDYLENKKKVTPEEYVKIKRPDNKLYDKELRLYRSEGFKIVKVIDNYFPDPESLNYGVLIYRKNPFWNWPMREALAWLIGLINIKIIRTFI